jgi:L-2-aminoadipate reductase
MGSADCMWEPLERWAQRLQNFTVSPLTRDYPEIVLPDSAKRPIEAFECLQLSQDAQCALRKLSSSGFSVFLTAFMILVARLTGDEDISIGTSSAGDGRPFVLRVPVNASESFTKLQAKVEAVLIVFSHPS